MIESAPAYGLWWLVALNVALFVGFAFSFFKPRSATDWRTLGTFGAFVLALFVEMYGFPLTIYLLSGWLQTRYPGLDLLSHDAGHLWSTIFGLEGNPHFNLPHILSNVLIVAGFLLLGSAWKVLLAAQKAHRLATWGVYARVRHPQYLAFILILVGFLLQWPTILTVAMFPVLVVRYVLLAREEEVAAKTAFGADWERYAATTPPWVPRLPGPGPSNGTVGRA